MQQGDLFLQRLEISYYFIR